MMKQQMATAAEAPVEHREDLSQEAVVEESAEPEPIAKCEKIAAEQSDEQLPEENEVIDVTEKGATSEEVLSTPKPTEEEEPFESLRQFPIDFNVPITSEIELEPLEPVLPTHNEPVLPPDFVDPIITELAEPLIPGAELIEPDLLEPEELVPVEETTFNSLIPDVLENVGGVSNANYEPFPPSKTIEQVVAIKNPVQVVSSVEDYDDVDDVDYYQHELHDTVLPGLTQRPVEYIKPPGLASDKKEHWGGYTTWWTKLGNRIARVYNYE